MAHNSVLCRPESENTIANPCEQWRVRSHPRQVDSAKPNYDKISISINHNFICVVVLCIVPTALASSQTKLHGTNACRREPRASKDRRLAIARFHGECDKIIVTATHAHHARRWTRILTTLSEREAPWFIEIRPQHVHTERHIAWWPSDLPNKLKPHGVRRVPVPDNQCLVFHDDSQATVRERSSEWFAIKR